MSETYS